MAIIKSPYPDLDIPKVDILSFLFPRGHVPSDKPIWIDADDPSSFLTPRQLLLWVKRLGYGLEKLGIGQDVCMIFTPNHIFVPVAYLGIVGYGAAFTGCNPAYTVAEIVHQLRDTETKMMLVHPSLVQQAVKAADEVGLPHSRIFLFSDDKPIATPFHDVKDWRTMIGTPEQGAGWQWNPLSAAESTSRVATINYSSGTTGMPKGVCISHHSLISNVVQTIFIRDQDMPYNPSERPEERWIGFLPLYHAYGQLYTNMMAPKLNIPVYIMKTFRFENFLRVIQDYRITSMQTAPPILVMLSKRPETADYDLSSLRDILCGAAPLKKELQNDVSTRFKVGITQGWGMTEVTCGAISMPRGRYDDSGSVGFLLPNCTARLLDDEGKDVQPGQGQRGELYVKGPNICLRYWKNEVATKESFQDGWLKTGDVAVVNKEGLFWIVDRKKELIKVNGLQVAPAELEALLLENSHITDAAVVGITLHGNEWPRAYVVLSDKSRGKVSEKDIQQWVASRVAKHKHLVGGVNFIDEVPKLASGKIQRKVMRQWAEKDAEKLESGRGDIQARL